LVLALLSGGKEGIVPNDLYEFLKELNIDIQINDKQAAPRIEYDFDMCSTILLFTLDFFAKGSDLKAKRIVKRKLLYTYLYIFQYPRELSRFINKKNNKSLSLIIADDNTADVAKVWEFYETPYTFLKVQGFVEDLSETEISITPNGEVFIKSYILQEKVQNAFSEHKQVFEIVKDSKVTLKDIGI
jgi:hypothetical protein